MASWNKLADRCRLFTDRPRALLIELLKEAEEELVRKCDILEKEMDYTFPFYGDLTSSGTSPESSDLNKYVVLPGDYKKIIDVVYKGISLNKIDQTELFHRSDNSLNPGTPTSYYVRQNRIYFNKYPESNAKLKVYYYGTSIPVNKNFVAFEAREVQDNSIVRFETDLTTELNGLVFKVGLKDSSSTSGYSFLESTASEWNSTYIATQEALSHNIQTYKLTLSDLDQNDSGSEVIKNGPLMIKNYRSVAPIIPDHFHRNLCDYAIALSTPELHDKHMIVFENSINEIKNEDAERDLVHEVKKEVYNSANLYR